MFDLVDRCEDYPQFLPWCGGVEVLERNEAVTKATIRIAYKGVRSHFTTENQKTHGEIMVIRLVDGPFRRLEGFWRFVPLAEKACKVEFRLQYEFSSRVLEKVVGPVFNHIAGTFIDAFVQRAQSILHE